MSSGEMPDQETADAIYHYAAVLLRDGTPGPEVERKLRDKGISAEAAANVVRNLGAVPGPGTVGALDPLSGLGGPGGLGTTGGLRPLSGLGGPGGPGTVGAPGPLSGLGGLGGLGTTGGLGPMGGFSASQAEERRAAGRKNMIYGALICAIGTAVTVGSYVLASGGGTYIIAGGAIVFGAVQFFRGLQQYLM